MAELERLIFQHMLEKLNSQQVYIHNLRNQASISAAITGLVATFFGTLIGDKQGSLSGDALLGLSLVALIAFALFGASIMYSAFVVAHTYYFTFSFNTEKMLLNFRKSEGESEFIEKYLTDGEWFFKDNEALIAKAKTNVILSLIFGFSQIIPWLLITGGY